MAKTKIHLSRLRIHDQAMATTEAAIGPLLATPSQAVFEVPEFRDFDPYSDFVVQMIAKEYTSAFGGDLSPGEDIGFLGVLRRSPQTTQIGDDLRVPTDDELARIVDYCSAKGMEVVSDMVNDTATGGEMPGRREGINRNHPGPSDEVLMLQRRVESLEKDLEYLRGRHYALCSLSALAAKRTGVEFARFGQVSDYMENVIVSSFPNVTDMERQGVMDCIESFRRLDSHDWTPNA